MKFFVLLCFGSIFFRSGVFAISSRTLDCQEVIDQGDERPQVLPLSLRISTPDALQAAMNYAVMQKTRGLKPVSAMIDFLMDRKPVAVQAEVERDARFIVLTDDDNNEVYGHGEYQEPMSLKKKSHPVLPGQDFYGVDLGNGFRVKNFMSPSFAPIGYSDTEVEKVFEVSPNVSMASRYVIRQTGHLHDQSYQIQIVENHSSRIQVLPFGETGEQILTMTEGVHYKPIFGKNTEFSIEADFAIDSVSSDHFTLQFTSEGELSTVSGISRTKLIPYKEQDREELKAAILFGQSKRYEYAAADPRARIILQSCFSIPITARLGVLEKNINQTLFRMGEANQEFFPASLLLFTPVPKCFRSFQMFLAYGDLHSCLAPIS